MAEALNRWTNRETQTIHEWLTKEPRQFPSFSQPGVNAYRAAGRDTKRAARILAEEMKRTIKAKSEELQLVGVWRVLIDEALEKANWDELAESFMVDVVDAVENY